MDREFDGNAFVGLLKKIDEILKRGKIRGNQIYTVSTTLMVNCMGHSFFNFENQDIEKLGSEYEEELRDYFWLFERFRMCKHRVSPKKLCKKAEEDLLDKICLAGLDIEECSLNDEIKKGQFKVAYYFDFTQGNEGFHFIRQEEDGSWSSKNGGIMNVEKLVQLPKRYENYELVKIFKVTNPYIYKEVDEKN